MVKVVELHTIVDRCSVQQFWTIVYEQPDVQMAFHRWINLCEAEISPWEDGKRTISFSMAMAAPDFVKRLLAVDSIHVEEGQTCLWNGSNSFTISSSTNVMNVSAAQRFTTKLRLTVSSRSPSSSSTSSLGESVDLQFSVEVSAGVVWPLSTSIENVMAEQATKSMTQWVDFACKAVEETLAIIPPTSPSPALATLELGGDLSNRIPSSVLPSPSLIRAGSGRRWPTAIVSRSSSSFPRLPGGEDGSGREDGSLDPKFLDAFEAFSTPASSMKRSRYISGLTPSELITPLLEEGERDAEEGLGFSNPAAQREEHDVEEGRQERRAHDAYMKMVATALTSLTCEVKGLRTIVESLQRSGPPHPSGTTGILYPQMAICAAVLFLLALWTLGLIFCPYKTGLVLPPPSPQGMS